MINLNKYPFVRLILPYGLGIWSAYNGLDFFKIKLLVALIVIFSISMALSFHFIKKYSLRWLYGAFLSLVLILAGMVNVSIQRPEMINDHLIKLETSISTFQARIIEPPVKKAKSSRFLLELESYEKGGEHNKVIGKVLAYISNSDSITNLKYGDKILFTKAPEIVAAPLNPGQFNYKVYLAQNGIFHQVFLKDSEWWKLNITATNPIFKFAYLMRDRLLHMLQKNGLDGDEFAVASTILLGYDDNLPAYLRKGYTAAGAMHVLCVSGLHVGIIFLIFEFLLSFMKQSKVLRFFRVILLFVIVWFYAMLTGLSPSVLRATIMISFVLIGQMIQRKGFLINSLAASAFLLLWINPATLFHIGFQLSYGAVLGIVLLQKPINDLLYFKNSFLSRVWEVSSVALAAQLATTPLVLHYFNQFPSYFIVSNLFLVPISFLVIVFGMALLLTSYIPLLPLFIGWITSGLIFIMNYLIHLVETLPYAVLQGLYITRLESLLMIFLVILLVLFFNNGVKRWFIAFITIFTILFTSVTARNIKNHQQNRMIIYGVNRYTAVDFISGTQHIFMADSALMLDEFAIGFNLKNFWTQSGFKDSNEWFTPQMSVTYPNLKKVDEMIEFQGKTIVLWDKKSRFNSRFTQQIKVDYILVTGNTPEALKEIAQRYDFNLLVLDASLPIWYRSTWRENMSAASKPFYDVVEQGAFVVDF